MLSKYPLLPASQLPPFLLNALELSSPICHVDVYNVSSNLEVSVNTDIRLDFLEEQQQTDPVYQEIFEAIGKGVLETKLDTNHPIKELNLQISGLHIIKGESY